VDVGLWVGVFVAVGVNVRVAVLVGAKEVTVEEGTQVGGRPLITLKGSQLSVTGAVA
jgi:hypothetical protein